MNGSQPGDQTPIRWADKTADPWRTDSPRPEARGPLRIPMVEEPYDAQLEQRLLKQAGLDFTAVVADTKEDFVRQLDAFRPDIILSDFALPGFSGRDVLKITRERYPQLPFVFLSGVLGDEAAVELIKQGATDYVLKDRPARLATVVRRAVEEVEQRAERARLQAQLPASGCCSCPVIPRISSAPRASWNPVSTS